MMGKLCLLKILIVLLQVVAATHARNSYTLSNNGYDDFVVAIHNDVAENKVLVDRIKEVFTEASKVLFRASKNRLFFRNITVVIPSTWKKQAEYYPALTRSFETANVIIDNNTDKNVIYADSPYVKQSRDCGAEGEYMHLTPNYILDKEMALRYYGPYGKTIVHEFAHLRWGLYDEYGDDEFGYFYKSGGSIESIGCTTAVLGSKINYKTGQPCATNETTGLPENDCRFYPNPTQNAKASLMYMQFLDSVEDFCDSNRWNKAVLHSSTAPNLQNRLCEGKSSWDIMKNHPDFTGDQSIPQEVLDPTPVFHMVQQSESSERKRICLVLDISGSMKGEPLEKMRQATSAFILGTVEDYSKVGIVLFSTAATIAQSLLEVTNSADRDMLISKLPSSTERLTSIGSGLREAIKVLTDGPVDEEEIAGSQIILLTDGKENRAPFIADVKPEVAQLGITVHSIAYGQKADTSISSLAASTGGRSMYAATSGQSTGVQDALNTIAGGKGSSDKKARVTVVSESVYLKANSVYEGTFVIDSTVGNDSFLSFTYVEGIEVKLTTPDGTVFDKQSSSYKDLSQFKVLTISLSGIAQVGKYTYEIQSTANTYQYVVVGMTSRSRVGGSEPIRVVSSLQSGALSFTETTVLKIYADLLQGYRPVVGVAVEAVIERPDGNSNVVSLHDNGAGCDVRKRDGQYCGYFIAQDFKGNGRYSVKIEVSTKDGQSAKIIGNRAGSASLLIMSTDTVSALSEGSRTATSVGSIQRTDSAGEVTVSSFPTDPSYTVPDRVPPSRIRDLRVYLVQEKITLKWTAPGDDMTIGNASSYEIRMAQNYTVLESGQFTTDQMISQQRLTRGSLTKPSVANNEEEFSFIIQDFNRKASYFLCVRTFDDAGNVADISNIVVTSYAPPMAGDGNNVGVAVGVTFAVLALVAIVIVVIVIFVKPKFAKTAPAKDAEDPVKENITSPTEHVVVENEKENTKSITKKSPEVVVNGKSVKQNVVVLPPLKPAAKSTPVLKQQKGTLNGKKPSTATKSNSKSPSGIKNIAKPSGVSNNKKGLKTNPKKETQAGKLKPLSQQGPKPVKSSGASKKK